VIAVGFTLQPHEETLALCEPLIEREVDYYEVAPETLWRPDGAGRFVPNGFHRRFEALRARTGRPFVAHGVGLSVGTASGGDEPRRRLWLETIAATQRAFDFRWYTDHLGATVLDGRELTLPLALPMDEPTSTRVRGRLLELQQIVPDAGLENSVFYYLLGAPLDEPAFLARCLDGPRLHLLLDLHNVFTMAVNFGFEPEDYLARLSLERVIEIHLSGGETSEPGWLGGETMRLDSHDHEVPEEVWRLFERALPRCPNLRGVTLERMEGTVTSADVPHLCEELRRIRALVA
jgi:uncharacterized protein (UPF0276 family)